MFESFSFQLDYSVYEKKRARNAQFKFLHCCSEGEDTPADEEIKKFSSFSDFWKITRQCGNIETISIPDNLVIEIDTLKERLPKLKSVIIRVGDQEIHKTAESFRAHFNQRLFIGKNGVTIDTLPDHEIKPAKKLIPYIPELFPGIKRVNVARSIEDDWVDYKWPKRENYFSEGGLLDLGLEILQQAKDCI